MNLPSSHRPASAETQTRDDLSPGASSPEATTTDMFRVTIARGSHCWTFACAGADERSLVLALAELAERADCPLGRFDAWQVGRQIRRQIRSHQSGRPPGPQGHPHPGPFAQADQNR